MECQRMVTHLSLDECPPTEVAARLRKHTGVDLAAVPENYAESLCAARRRLCETLKLSLVYQSAAVSFCGENEAILGEGCRLCGAMPPRILHNAQQAVCFVATLAGFNELRSSMPDMLDNYFLDAWGTVYVECAQHWLESRLQERLEGTGQRPAYAWNPGQHGFDLCNQRPLFDFLHPEDIGCTLDRHMRMLPYKSTSGVIPVLPETAPAELDLIPCDFCSFAKTCPASKARRG